MARQPIMRKFLGGTSSDCSRHTVMFNSWSSSYPDNVTSLPQRHKKTRTMRKAWGGGGVGNHFIQTRESYVWLGANPSRHKQACHKASFPITSSDARLPGLADTASNFDLWRHKKFPSKILSGKLMISGAWFVGFHKAAWAFLPHTSHITGYMTKCLTVTKVHCIAALRPADKILVEKNSKQPVIRQDIDAGKNRFATFFATIRFSVKKQALLPAKQMVVYKGAGKKIDASEKKIFF